MSSQVTARIPDVSVLVPARNEEANIGACLQSLVDQRDINFELIVVDDHSTDRTVALARSFPGVKVISADPLPPGWCGKQHALHCGVRHARGRWLLFTDADTLHKPVSLARAVQEAKDADALLLSYSPRQEVRTFWERAIMPVVFAELASTFRPRDVCDPASPAAAANGQYLLIRRDIYETIGGHAAFCDTLLDDVAIARAVKQRGGRIRFRYGSDAVSTRMYRDFAALREGWTKNLALLFPDAKQLAALRGAEFLVISASMASMIAFARKGRPTGLVISAAILAASYGGFLRRIRRAHFGIGNDMLAIFGLPIFSLLLRRSAIYYGSGRGIRWRGREYKFSEKAGSSVLAPRKTGASK